MFSFTKKGYIKKAGIRNFCGRRRACPIRGGGRIEIQTLKETMMRDFIIITIYERLPHVRKNIFSVFQVLKIKL